MSRYQFLGVNDDRNFCECCGKQDLKRVVWIEDTEEGTIKHFGTTCATNPGKAFGHKMNASIRSASASYDRNIYNSKCWAYWEVKALRMDAAASEAMASMLTTIYYNMTYMGGQVKEQARTAYETWMRDVYYPRKAQIAKC